jgi:plant G-box-binding factor
MASSSEEQPKPPETPAVTAAPQTHAEWAASLQAYYAAAGHPYAWPAQVKKKLAFMGAAPAGSVPTGIFFSHSLPTDAAPDGRGGGGGHVWRAGAVPRLPPRRRGGVLRARVHGRGECAPPAPVLPPVLNWGKLGSDLWGFWSEFAAAVQGVPYPTTEAAAVAVSASAAEAKGKGKGEGASPEKGSSGAPSAEDASRRYLPALTVAVSI